MCPERKLIPLGPADKKRVFETFGKESARFFPAPQESPKDRGSVRNLGAINAREEREVRILTWRSHSLSAR